MIQKMINRIMLPARNIHLWYNRKSLKNHSFTIIANNCIGGIIYHDLQEEFRSPTINLWMTPLDFCILCEHLEYYMQLHVTEVQFNESYPVGELQGIYGNVHVYFQHYKSFEEANAKWEERKKRIRWNEIYLICEAPFENEKTLHRLLALPYNKRVITHTHTHTSSDKELVKMPYKFYFKDYRPGKLIGYPRFGIRRFMEKLDYVDFLNDFSVSQ